MEFGLSQEQILLQDSVTRFLRDTATLDQVRQVAAGDSTDQPIWEGLSALGIAGLIIPEASGGVGLGLLEAVVVSEALGYAVAPGPFLSSAIIAPTVLLAAGQLEQLPDIAAGTKRVGIAFSESVGARAGAGVHADGDRLSGRALFALDAEADAYLVNANQGTTFWVDANATGFTRRLLTTIDKTRTICELQFESTPGQRISDDPSIIQAGIDAGRIAQAADSLGAAQCMLDQAVAYALQRKQFNRVIGSFQAVKHLCAEMASQLEPCRALIWYGGHALSQATDDAKLTICHANAHLSEVAQFVAKTSTEVHGGMGFTDLVGLHYWFKRIGANRQLLGSPEAVRAQAAELQQLTA